MEEQNEYKKIFNLSMDIICKVGPDGNFKDINPAFTSILEWEISDVLHNPFTKYIHPEDIEHTTNEITKQFNGNGSDVIVNRYKTKNGGYKHISWKGNINKETGDLYGIGRDVSEQIQKEEEFQLITKVVSKTKDAVVITDQKGYIVWVNDSFAKISEYSKDEVLGKKPGSFLQGKNTNLNTVAEIRKAVIQKEEIDVNIINYSKSGKEYWLNINISPIYDDKNQIEYFIAIERDVTKEIIQQEEKRIADERWKIAIENSNYGLWDWNILTNETFFSDAWKKTLGYSNEEIENHVDEWTKRVHPDDIILAEKDIEKHLKGESEYYESTHRILCKDGSYKWILDRGKIVEWNPDGKPSRMIGTLNDLTNEIENKRQLLINQEKLKEAQFISKIGNWEFNEQKKQLFWSDEMYNIYEIDNSVKDEELLKLFHKSMNQEQFKNLESTIETSKVNKETFKIERKLIIHNKVKYIYAISSPFYDNNGNYIGLKGTIQDITERKLIEQEFEKVKDNLDTVIKTLNEGIVLQDTNGAILHCNPAAEEILGLTYDQMIGKKSVDPSWRAVHEDGSDYPGETHPAMRTLATGKSILNDVMGVHKPNDELTWININAVLMPNNRGVVCSFTDITERKKIENIIHRNEEMLYQTNKIAQVGAWEYRADQSVFWSEITREIFELPKDFETQFDDLKQFYPNKNLELLLTSSRKTIETGEPFEIILEIETNNKNFKWVKCKGEAEYKNDQFVRLYGAYQDITEQTKAEIQITNSKNHFQALVNNSPLCIHEIDLEGKLISMNAAGLKMMGVDSFEEINQSLYLNVVCTTDRPRIENLLKRAIQNESSRFEFESVNGSIFKSNFVPINDEFGKVSRLMGITEDISEKHFAEQELIIAKEKAEQASIAKSDFLANMSHEIRTPLNGIIGFSDLLKTTKLNSTQELFSNTIIQSANSLLGVINDILDFSKIEAGKLELDIQKSNLVEIACEAIDAVTFQAQSKKLELLLNIDTSLPSHFYFDPTRVRQIMVNLLGNAIKFTSVGEVELKIETLKTNKKEAKIRFSVRDTGVGIDKQNQSKIFDAFSQADTSTTRKFGGTGLGLSISNRLLQLMANSSLQLISELNEGSTFYFDLELTFENTIKQPSIQEKIQKAIILTDYFNLSSIIKKYLKHQNIEAELIFKKDDFITEFQKIDESVLIVLDSEFDSTKAYDLIELVSEKIERQLTKNPTILLSCSIDDDYTFNRCKILNVQHQLLKPIKPNSIFDKINLIANGLKNGNSEKIERSIKTDSILLVDDNAINRLLASTLIKKIAPNCNLIEAENGLEAVEKYKEHQPVLIFMDIHMPEMDGYKASEIIIQSSINNIINIIALRAENNLEERRKSKIIGMKESISKPINPEELENLIQKYYFNK